MNPQRLSAVPTPVHGIRSLLLLSGLFIMVGCQLPNFPGPAIQEPPRGFLKEADAGQQRMMFPGLESVFHDALVNAAWGDVSTIHINGYPGSMMRADVQAALDDAVAAETEPVTYSGLQELTIDGRRAWGWAERLHTDELGLVWIAYKVAIPYDTITYVLELNSGDPALKRNPDTLLAIASTFAVGETRWNVPLILGMAVLLVVIIRTLQRRSHEKRLRLQSITLKKVEVEDGEVPAPKPVGDLPTIDGGELKEIDSPGREEKGP